MGKCTDTQIIKYVAGDEAQLAFLIKDDDGSVFDLSGSTVVLAIDDGVPTNVTALPVDYPHGKGVFQFLPTTLVAGRHHAQIQITDPSSRTVSIGGLLLDVAEKINA